MFEGGLAAIDKALEETGQKSLHLASATASAARWPAR